MQGVREGVDGPHAGVVVAVGARPTHAVGQTNQARIYLGAGLGGRFTNNGGPRCRDTRRRMTGIEQAGLRQLLAAMLAGVGRIYHS